MQRNSDDEQALMKIQHEWADARLKRVTPVLEK
jgi:hypothetical protein